MCRSIDFSLAFRRYEHNNQLDERNVAYLIFVLQTEKWTQQINRRLKIEMVSTVKKPRLWTIFFLRRLIFWCAVDFEWLRGYKLKNQLIGNSTADLADSVFGKGTWKCSRKMDATIRLRLFETMTAQWMPYLFYLFWVISSRSAVYTTTICDESMRSVSFFYRGMQ